jgi:hypothetical protein
MALYNAGLEQHKLGKLTEAIECGEEALSVLKEVEAPDIDKVRDKVALGTKNKTTAWHLNQSAADVGPSETSRS